MSSPSLLLALWIAVADIPLRVTDFITNPLTYGGGPGSRDPHLARFLAWFTIFTTMWIVYLNVMIALDIHLAIFCNTPIRSRIRSIYPYIGTGVAFFISFWYLLLPGVRFLSTGAITVSVSGSLAAQFFTIWMCFWLYSAILYVFGVVMAIFVTVFRLRRQANRFVTDFRARSCHDVLLKNARSVMAYPTVLFVVYFPYVLYTLLVALGMQAILKDLDSLQNVLFSTHGILMFSTLLFHPVMQSANRQGYFSPRDFFGWLSARTQTALGRLRRTSETTASGDSRTSCVTATATVTSPPTCAVNMGTGTMTLLSSYWEKGSSGNSNFKHTHQLSTSSSLESSLPSLGDDESNNSILL
ncbi:hypothetical protein H4R33_003420 [Dimargaris cristalligena]|nr:hypothetical protein H4R33_003420 [Dimargaris cristalligena]